jgi:hypothetical protein
MAAMVDWLVLLVPLAALPIAFLFTFVGCQVLFPVDTTWPMVGLYYPAGLQSDVFSLTIKFSFQTADGEYPSELRATETLANADIEPAGTFIDKRAQVDLREAGEGFLICTCSIIKMNGGGETSPPIVTSNHQSYEGDREELNYFELVRDGDSFQLKVSEVY